MKKMEHKLTFTEYIGRYVNEIKSAVYSAFVFLNIDTDVVKILIYLMIIDTFFGIVKSVVLKKKLSHKILLLGLTTKSLVLLIPMTLALVGLGLKTYDFTPLVDIVLRILVASEGFSIITSMYVIKTKKDVENFDFITMLLNSLRKGILSLIKGWLGQIENVSNKEE